MATNNNNDVSVILDNLVQMLENSGMDRAQELVSQLQASDLVKDPKYGTDDATTFKINSAQFVNSFLNDNATPMQSNNNDLLFMPKFFDGNLIGFNAYYSVEKDNKKLITNKIMDFSLNLTSDTSGFVRTGSSGGVIEGISFDANANELNGSSAMFRSKTNFQAVEQLLKAAINPVTKSVSEYYENNPNNINVGELQSLVKYDQFDHAKNYESHRALALQTELEFAQVKKGILTPSILKGILPEGSGDVGGLGYFDTFSGSEIGNFVDRFTSNLSGSIDSETFNKEFAAATFSSSFDKVDKLYSIGGTRNPLEAKEKIINKINNANYSFINDVNRKNAINVVNDYFENLDIFNNNNMNLSPLGEKLSASFGLHDRVNSFYSTLDNSSRSRFSLFSNMLDAYEQDAGERGWELTPDQINKYMKKLNYGNQDMITLQSGFGYLEQQTYRGSQLNSALGITNLNSDNVYSFNDVLAMNRQGQSGLNLNTSQINNLSMGFHINNADQMTIHFNSIANGKFVQNSDVTTFGIDDVNRAMESQFKSRGLFIAEALFNGGVGFEDVRDNLTNLNASILARDSQQFNTIASGLGLHDSRFQTMLDDAFTLNQPLNISQVVNKDKFKGITSMMGHSVYGDLAIMNKKGARSIQARDTLTDFVMTDHNGLLYNVTDYMSRRYAGHGGLLGSDMFTNVNAVVMNQRENALRAERESKFNFRHGSNVRELRTRRNVNVLVGDIMSIIPDNARARELQKASGDPSFKTQGKRMMDYGHMSMMGHDEAAYISPNVSNALIGETHKSKHLVTRERIMDYLASYETPETKMHVDVAKAMKEYDAITDAKEKFKYLDSNFNFFGGYADFYEDSGNYFQRNIKDGKYKGKRKLNKFFFNKAKKGSGFDGIRFKDSFYVNLANTSKDVMIDEDGNLVMDYYSVSRAQADTKIHGMTTTYKATVSGVTDLNITYDDELTKKKRNYGLIGAMKSDKREWGGGTIMGMLRAGLLFSDESKKQGEFLDALNNEFFTDKIMGNSFLGLLGLTVNTENGLIYDNNVGAAGTNLQSRDLVDNAYLKTLYGNSQLQTRLKNAKIGSPEQLEVILNSIYEKVMGKDLASDNRLIGKAVVEINGEKMHAMVRTMVDSLAITGADQTFTFGDALTIKEMESRMLATKGLTALDDIIRAGISSRGSKFFSQIVSAGDYSIKSLGKKTNSMAYSKDFLDAIEKDENVNLVRIHVDDIVKNFGTQLQGLATSNSSSDFYGVKSTTVNELEDIIKSKGVGKFKEDQLIQLKNVATAIAGIPAHKSQAEQLIAAASGDKPSSRAVSQAAKSLLKSVQKKGIMEHIDPNGVFLESKKTAAMGLDRTLPVVSYEGETLDYINKSIKESLAEDKMFDKGDEVLKTAFGTYVEHVEKQLAKGKKINKFEREKFLKVLNEYRNPDEKRFKVSNEFLNRLAHTENDDETARLLNMMDGNFINFNNLTKGIFKDQYSIDHLGSVNKIMENVSKMATLKAADSLIADLKTAADLDDEVAFGNAVNKALEKNVIMKKKFREMNASDLKIIQILTEKNKNATKLSSAFAAINATKAGTQEREDAIDEFDRAMNQPLSFQNYNLNEAVNNLEHHRKQLLGKVFNNIYSPQTDIINNLTRKKSLFTSKLSFDIKTSLSGQWSEGSNLLNKMAETVTQDIEANHGNVKSIKELKSYKDITEAFGDDFADMLIFDKGDEIENYLDPNTHKFDVSHSQRLKDRIMNLMDIVITNTEGIGREKKWLGRNFDRVDDEVSFGKGTIGIAGRFPLQQADNINATLNIGMNLKRIRRGMRLKSKGKRGVDSYDNFIYEALDNMGFRKTRSGMVIGKGTAAKFGGDFDGDKFFFGLLRENLKNSGIDEKQKKLLYKQMRMSFFTTNDVSMEKFSGRLAKMGIDLKDQTVMKALKNFQTYANHSREMAGINLRNTFQDYHSFMASIMRDDEAMGILKELTYYHGGDMSELSEEKRAKLIKSARGTMNISGGMTDSDIAEKISELASRSDYHEVAADVKKAMKGGNIGKAGMVHKTVNDLRNLDNIFAGADIGDDFLDKIIEQSMKTSGSSTNESLNPDLFRNMALDMGIDISELRRTNGNKHLTADHYKKAIISNLRREQKLLKKHGGPSGMFIFEAIERGVISAKNDSEFIYKILEETANRAMGKSGEEIAHKKLNLSFLKGMSENIDDRDYQTLDEQLNKILESDSSVKGAYETLMDAKRVGADNKDRFNLAAIVISGIENTRSVSKFGQVFRNIGQKYGLDQTKRGSMLSGLARMVGIENTRYTKKGRKQNTYSHYKAATGGMGFGSLYKKADVVVSGTVEKVKKLAGEMTILGKSSEKIKDVGKEMEDIADEVNEVGGDHKGFSGALAIGALALGGFIGYNIGNSNNRTQSVTRYKNPLGIGDPNTQFNYERQSDLGY